jgi:pullulanase
MNIPENALPMIRRIFFESDSKIIVLLEEPSISFPDISSIEVLPKLEIASIRREGQKRFALFCDRIDIRNNYRISFPGNRRYVILPDRVLDSFYTDKDMGHTFYSDKSLFRFFAPRAIDVKLALYKTPESLPFKEVSMNLDSTNGCWEFEIDAISENTLYTYRVTRRSTLKQNFNKIITGEFPDPWSCTIVKNNSWPNRSLSLVEPERKKSNTPITHKIIPTSEMLIYEAHVKDSTILDTSLEIEDRGKYSGLTASNKNGFIHHLNRMGINTLELLPIQDYCYYEPPYGKKVGDFNNTWNETSLNHWGYMTAHFFAPDARYSNSSNNGWIGTDGSQVDDVRCMISRFHKAGIAVILDVVYNHVSQYSNCALRELDPYYFLRNDKYGDPTTLSGCGNDFATERPMNRRLIIESLVHWVEYYGVDGFRFDLAGLIDDKTLELLTERLRSVYPEIHLIAEPWGGLYDKSRYSKLDWSSWNDIFRDSIKGSQPHYGNGYIAGSSHHNLNQHLGGNIKSLGGPYVYQDESINYLASHDGYSYGDFIREQNSSSFAIDSARKRDNHSIDMKQHKLGLFILYISRGIPMISQGDEFDRSKLLRLKNNDIPVYDEDSYNKDDETNWIDWAMLDTDKSDKLIKFIRNLILLRKSHPSLRFSQPENISELSCGNECAFGYQIETENDSLVILMNSSPDKEATLSLPDGKWSISLSTIDFSQNKKSLSDNLTIPEISGYILIPV